MIAGLHHNSIRPARAQRVVLCSAMLLAFVSLAAAQEPTPQQYNAPAQEPAAPAGAAAAATPSTSLPTPPEVIGAIGRLLNQSINNVGAAANAGANARWSIPFSTESPPTPIS